MTQRCENSMAVQAICRMFEHLSSHGIQLVLRCRVKGDGHHCAVQWCHQWCYLVVCYWFRYAHFKVSDSNSLQSLHHILKCGSKGLPMALWSSMDGFTTQYTIFKLCHIVTHTSCSPNWLNCSAQMPASVFTQSNAQVCHPHQYSRAMNAFQLYMPHTSK